jgi:hypothetical protein
MNAIDYPTAERLIEYNFLALEFIKVKKADQPKVLSHSKLNGVIADCEKKEGGLPLFCSKALFRSILLPAAIEERHL